MNEPCCCFSTDWSLFIRSTSVPGIPASQRTKRCRIVRASQYVWNNQRRHHRFADWSTDAAKQYNETTRSRSLKAHACMERPKFDITWMSRTIRSRTHWTGLVKSVRKRSGSTGSWYCRWDEWRTSEYPYIVDTFNCSVVELIASKRCMLLHHARCSAFGLSIAHCRTHYNTNY